MLRGECGLGRFRAGPGISRSSPDEPRQHEPGRQAASRLDRTGRRGLNSLALAEGNSSPVKDLQAADTRVLLLLQLTMLVLATGSRQVRAAVHHGAAATSLPPL